MCLQAGFGMADQMENKQSRREFLQGKLVSLAKQRDEATNPRVREYAEQEIIAESANLERLEQEILRLLAPPTQLGQLPPLDLPPIRSTLAALAQTTLNAPVQPPFSVAAIPGIPMAIMPPPLPGVSIFLTSSPVLPTASQPKQDRAVAAQNTATRVEPPAISEHLPFRHAVRSTVFSRDSRSTSPPNFKKKKVSMMGLMDQRRQQEIVQDTIVQQSASAASGVLQTQLNPLIPQGTHHSSSRHLKCEHNKRTTR